MILTPKSKEGMTKKQEFEWVATKIIKTCQKYPSPMPLKYYLTKEELDMQDYEDFLFNTTILFVKQELIDGGYFEKTAVPNRETEEYFRLTDKGKFFKSFEEEKRLEDLKNKKLEVDLRNAERVYKTYPYTQFIAWITFAIALFLGFLRLAEALKWWPYQ
jgi:hypothetical protein